LRYLFLTLPRMLLGVRVGVVITVPLVIQIFSSEIDAQIVVDQQRAVNVFFASLPATPISKKVSADQENVASLQKVIEAGGAVPLDISQDPLLRNLTQQRDQAQQEAANAYNTWQQQLYGTGSGSVAGSGPLAAADHANYLFWTSQVSTLNSQIQARGKTVTQQAAAASATRVSQATSELPAARVRLESDQAELNFLTANTQRAINGNTGLLAHLQAFSEETKNSSLFFAAFTLFLMFLLIQILPIMVKVLLNLGPQSTYEKMVAYEEESWLRAAREDIARRQDKRNLE
jgi:hypothetical protein